MKKISIYSILIIGFFAFALFLILQAGWYPILMVNGSRVWASDYTERIKGFQHYQNIVEEKLDEDDVRRGILLSFVMDWLIQHELQQRDISDNSVNMQIEEALGGRSFQEFEKATRQLYGWTIYEFKEFSLKPQARQEILLAELEKEGINFNEWVEQELQAAQVKIYLLPYTWQNGQLLDK